MLVVVVVLVIVVVVIVVELVARIKVAFQKFLSAIY